MISNKGALKVACFKATKVAFYCTALSVKLLLRKYKNMVGK